MAVLGLIDLSIFNIDVAVFETDEARVDAMRKERCDATPHDAGAIASSHLDVTEDGEPRFSMVIKPHATYATWAHECAHIADFVMDTLGIPTGVENTEVRGYLIGHLFANLQRIMAKRMRKSEQKSKG